ncbi:MAG: MltA domain-containing protein [Sphingomonadaceae bacterium]|nr:MltA domain-containing protein [Sphingomonadaceae bacterium]
MLRRFLAGDAPVGPSQPSTVRSFVTLCIVVPSLAGCAGIVPHGSPRAAPPVSSAPRPAPTANTSPAARPTPATPGTPIAAPTPPADSANAIASGVVAGPAVATLALDDAMARRALAAFRTSCPSLRRRVDASGLTRAGDWDNVCTAAVTSVDGDARRFFNENFATVQVGDGRTLATGYFEPEIAGCRQRSTRCNVPIYGLPSDLVEVDLGQFSPNLAGRRIRGRVDGAAFVPYYDRSAIDGGALAGRGLEIAWAEDAVEFFFLQIQGSGRVRLADGTVLRIGYAGQNGRDYVGIGRLLRDRGELAAGEASMQGIMAYLRRQRDGGRAVMHENPSFVFFRALTGAGPLGSLGVPVVARTSVATDPAFVPLGAPVFLAMDRAEATGLWVAQDTGGAIRGSNRFDTFWGAGDEARAIAGGMSARGTTLLLLPRPVVARLTQP